MAENVNGNDKKKVNKTNEHFDSKKLYIMHSFLGLNIYFFSRHKALQEIQELNKQNYKFQLKLAEEKIELGVIIEKCNYLQTLLNDSTSQSDSLKNQLYQVELENFKLNDEISKIQKQILQLRQNTKDEIEQYLRISSSLENEISMLKSKQNRKISYEKDKWCTGWIVYWKEYLISNNSSISKKLSVLKQNIDQDSCNVIDLIIERNLYIFPLQKYSRYFLYDREQIFTPEEKLGMARPLDESSLREKYHIREIFYLETPVFHFHNGLTFLPKEITDRVNGRDIIDGGALWGDSTLVFSEHYTPRMIYSFEPSEISYQHLLETIKLNNLSNVLPVKQGLGQSQSEQILYTHSMLSGSNIFNCKALYDEQDEIQKETIQITSIDTFVKTFHPDVSLIKLDVEGCELSVIRGALDTIKTFRPILSISVYHRPEDLFEIKPILESLNLGYHFIFRKLVFHDPLTELTLLAYVD